MISGVEDRIDYCLLRARRANNRPLRTLRTGSNRQVVINKKRQNADGGAVDRSPMQLEVRRFLSLMCMYIARRSRTIHLSSSRVHQECKRGTAVTGVGVYPKRDQHPIEMTAL